MLEVFPFRMQWSFQIVYLIGLQIKVKNLKSIKSAWWARTMSSHYDVGLLFSFVIIRCDHACQGSPKLIGTHLITWHVTSNEYPSSDTPYIIHICGQCENVSRQAQSGPLCMKMGCMKTISNHLTHNSDTGSLTKVWNNLIYHLRSIS